MVTSQKWLKSGELEKTVVWVNNQNLVPNFLLVIYLWNKPQLPMKSPTFPVMKVPHYQLPHYRFLNSHIISCIRPPYKPKIGCCLWKLNNNELLCRPLLILVDTKTKWFENMLRIALASPGAEINSLVLRTYMTAFSKFPKISVHFWRPSYLYTVTSVKKF